jgi:ATP-dependent 26S proteasome regulatory subunit
MKKELKSVSGRFFDSKAVYEGLGVPWKRGLIFYGPAGNGKTISIKALMHTLGDRKNSIPTLYVKTAPRTFDIRNIFALARQMSPCLLVLEDIDTIVTAMTRSYFFNEVDGLENNDGILMVATTNHIDQLDPGLSKRPSRFDRKYLFPLSSKKERVEYVQFWRQKLKTKPEVEFPETLVEPIADITHDFSFAYIQEAFVSSLLDIAHHRNDEDEDEKVVAGAGGGDDDLDKYELWRESLRSRSRSCEVKWMIRL